MSPPQGEGGSQNKGKKRRMSPSVIHENRYSDLDTDSDGDEVHDEPIKATKKENKPVPLVIDTTKLSQENIHSIQLTMKAVDEEMVYIYNKTRMTYLTNSKEAHQKASKFLVEQKIPFHSYTRREEKQRNFIIKGMPPKDTADIIISLQDQGIDPINVKKIITKDPATPMYLVFINYETEINRLFTIKYVCSVKIKWQKYKNTRLATQCYNCQSFGHGSSQCHHKTKCVKCSGEHKAKDCMLKDEDKPICANCGKDHPANHTGCEKYIKHIETIKKRQPDKNTRLTKSTPKNFQGLTEANFPPVNAFQQQIASINRRQYSEVVQNEQNNYDYNTKLNYIKDNINIIDELYNNLKTIKEKFNLEDLLKKTKFIIDTYDNPKFEKILEYTQRIANTWDSP